MPVRALIVDDERLARKELRRLLAAHTQVEVVAEAANVAEAVRALEEHEPDLLFLDIEMPDGTGFDVLLKYDQPPQVIFTTAFDQHALEAFKVNALDYLLKPIDPKRLAAALDRAHSGPPRGSGKFIDRVFVRDGDRCWFLALSTVPLLESDGNYTRLHVEGRQPMLNRSLSYLEERLDPDVFFRASRQYLINLSAIAALEPGPEGRLVVRLTTGQELEMSRRQSQRFKDKMSP
jgi:two-component system, LytTR family, response regulator